MRLASVLRNKAPFSRLQSPKKVLGLCIRNEFEDYAQGQHPLDPSAANLERVPETLDALGEGGVGAVSAIHAVLTEATKNLEGYVGSLTARHRM